MVVGKTVVLDSGPLFHSTVDALLSTNGTEFFTIPEVMAEIKDEATRSRISILPFEIKVVSPSSAYINKVNEAAKKSGDFSVLSRTDLLVAALAYQKKCEADEKEMNNLASSLTLEKEEKEIVSEAEVPESTDKKDEPSAKVDDVVDDDDDGGWITPSNVKKVSKKLSAQAENYAHLEKSSVMCMSFDFAIQNLLVTLKVPVMAADGVFIKKIKTWVLRCYACFKISKEMERKFCSDCGGHTLTRVSCTIDANTGALKCHLKSNYKVYTRGNVYSIPQTKTGRNANNLILREDQKEYQRAVAKSQRDARKAASASDDINNVTACDYMPTIYKSAKEREASIRKQAMSEVLIGYGRKNPNQTKRATGNK